MKSLLIKLKNNINLKSNPFLKLYLPILILLNILYLCLEVYKSKITSILLLKDKLQESDFTKLTKISNTNNVLEYLIILIFFTYVIKLLLKRQSIQQFLILHMALLPLFALVSYIISVAFSAPFGNLTQQYVILAIATIIIFIYYISKTLLKKDDHLDVNN